MAADLVRRQVSVIAATSTPANLVAKASTSTIPIVFATGDDPVQLGLVTSLNRAGRQPHGSEYLEPRASADGKRQDILIEAVPWARRMAMLADANATAPQHLKTLRDAARARGVETAIVTPRMPETSRRQ